MKKVLIIQKIHEEGIKLLENKPNYTFEVIDSEEMIEKIDENWRNSGKFGKIRRTFGEFLLNLEKLRKKKDWRKFGEKSTKIR